MTRHYFVTTFTFPGIDQALCSEHPNVDFFAETTDEAQPALAICNRCPARTPCLNAALQLPEAADYGILGGTRARERTRMRKNRR